MNSALPFAIEPSKYIQPNPPTDALDLVEKVCKLAKYIPELSDGCRGPRMCDGRRAQTRRDEPGCSGIKRSSWMSEKMAGVITAAEDEAVTAGGWTDVPCGIQHKAHDRSLGDAGKDAGSQCSAALSGRACRKEMTKCSAG